MARGEVKAVLVVLGERFGAVPPEVAARVQATSESAVLDELLARALRISRPEDLFP